MTRAVADPLRVATWRLEATGAADPALLLRAGPYLTCAGRPRT
ncbi:hypothetical protein [Streptomyces sp. NPDC047108]